MEGINKFEEKNYTEQLNKLFDDLYDYYFNDIEDEKKKALVANFWPKIISKTKELIIKRIKENYYSSAQGLTSVDEVFKYLSEKLPQKKNDVNLELFGYKNIVGLYQMENCDKKLVEEIRNMELNSSGSEENLKIHYGSNLLTGI